MSTQERVETQNRWGRPEQTPVRSGAVARPGAERLPRPPGRRRPGLAVIAVLLIVLGAAVAGLLATRIDDRVPVLVARRQISAGQQISQNDLAVAEVASSGLQMIRTDQAGQVIGRYANTTIAPGRLIDSAMLTGSGLLTAGNAAVGIALQQGRFPASGLKSGDVVEVVRSVEGAGKVIVDSAVVGTVQSSGSSVFGSSTSTNTLVTIICPQRDAAAVAAAALAQQVSLVLLQRGQPVGSG